jgi:hypothetical protein
MRTIWNFTRPTRRAVFAGLMLLLGFAPRPIMAQLQVAVTSTDASCPETNNGVAKALVSNGVAPFAYHWNTGATGHELTGLIPGTYSVTVSDANGNTATSQTAVELSGIESLLVVQNDVLSQDQTATFTAEAGFSSYLWTLSNPADQIIDGQGTYAITVRWHAGGTKNIQVLYSNGPGQCAGVLVYNAQVSQVTATDSPSLPDIKITPNPFERNFEINFSGDKGIDYSVRLTDMFGRTLATQVLSGSKATMDTPDLPHGQYLLWMHDEDHFLVKKVIKN